MDINELTFGVEIETTIPANTIAVGAYHVGTPIVGVEGLEGWVAMRDGSIGSGRGRRGCEFVSPVLKGIDGLKRVVAAVAAIKRLGGAVNASCGLHVHVGFDRSNARQVEKLTTLTANFERAIYATTGTKNRERGSYCRGLQQFGNFAAAHAGAANRYRLLNTATNKPTVEFRAFAGTLNPAKIIGHVRMCLALVERANAAKRTTNWTAKPVAATSPIKRSGEGQTALTRLFYQLGWIRGRADRVYGDLNASGLPTLLNTKRTLMKLARKYDAEG